MADINIRAYLREIDDLIERDDLDEAIAHCRHILQIYPKHLDTYRLLGKAYLEAKRFGDAADIFQRVLSAVPDDFVSHIGMAIVREDEGNLDAAIWHMERAFETNPANPAIRQELSRLIGRRDGLEPHKIRLTRGALARQYAQGELYPQAIAELRSALMEDPDRPDLEVLLGKMYWRSAQKEEARVICEQVLEKLPYCYEACQMMAAYYQEQDQPDKATEFHRKLAALDPYTAFLETPTSDPKTVDANAVRIEKSGWTPGQPLPTIDSQQPEWVASLGVELTSEEIESVETGEAPPWLRELEGEATTAEEGVAFGMGGESKMPAEPPEESAEIPDWMREAGWEPASGEAEEKPVPFSDEELEALEAGELPAAQASETGELAPAELPDWIQDIAPSEAPAPTVEPDEHALPPSHEELVPDWLSEISEGEAVETEFDEEPAAPEPETEEVASIEAAEAEAETEEEKPEVPTWIEAQSPGATSTIISWLGDRPSSEPSPEEEQLAGFPAANLGSPTEEPEEEIPSWLQDLGAEDEPASAGPSEATDAESQEPPSWLAGVAEAASQRGAEPPAPAELPEELPRAETPEEPEAAKAAEAAPAADTDWLKRLAQEEGGAEIPSAEEIPDWLAGVDEEAAASSLEEAPEWLQGIAEGEAGAAPTTEAEPDWMSAVEEEPQPEAPPSREEVPDWLMGIAEGEEAPEGPSAEVEETPDWLLEVEIEPSDTTIEAQTHEVEALREPEPETAEAPDMEAEPALAPSAHKEVDDEEVYEWLETLAVQQEGAASEEAPAGAGEAEVAEAAEPIMREEPLPEEPEEGLQWLEELAAQRGLDTPVAEVGAAQPEPEVPAEAEEETPDWLIEMATDETIVPSRPEPEMPAEEAIVSSREEIEPVPAEPPAREPEPTAVPEPEEEQIPGWLDEAVAAAAEVPAEPATETPPPPEPVVSTARATPETSTYEQPPAEMELLEEEPEPAAEMQAPSATEPEVVRTETAEPHAEPGPALTEPPLEEAAPVEPEPVLAEEPPAPAEEPMPEVEEAPEPEPPTGYREPLTAAEILLQSARSALAAGDAGRALSDYQKLIDRKQDLDTVIQDLQSAVGKYPNLAKMWQALGDAYMKADRLPDAIKAYQRGMEVA